MYWWWKLTFDSLRLLKRSMASNGSSGTFIISHLYLLFTFGLIFHLDCLASRVFCFTPLYYFNSYFFLCLFRHLPIYKWRDWLVCAFKSVFRFSRCSSVDSTIASTIWFLFSIEGYRANEENALNMETSIGEICRSQMPREATGRSNRTMSPIDQANAEIEEND